MSDELKKKKKKKRVELDNKDNIDDVPKTPEEVAAEYLGGWKRALADYDNLKRESEEKSKQWIEVGMMRVLEQMLPVYNNFKSAVNHIPPDQLEVPWVVGIMYIKKNLEDMFAELGLEIIPTVGEPFDEKLHEAMSEEEGEGEPGTIIKEVGVGFKKDGKVVLPARVVVIKLGKEEVRKVGK